MSYFKGYCDKAPSSPNPFNTNFFHQPLNRAACRGHRFSLELLSQLAHVVIAMALLPDTLDLRRELLVPLHLCTTPLWILLKCFIMMIRRWCNRQFFADWLDTVNITVLIDKVHHHFGLRSRSAWAKKAAPLRSISIVHLSLRTSGSSSFVRCDWLVVIPGYTPVSIFIFFTHERKVSGVQPILDATDCMAAQRDEWSCSPGKTNRTTCSRTSFEYPGHLFIS